MSNSVFGAARWQPTMLRIHLLGGFHLQFGDETITTLTVPRLQSLLAYLLLHRDAPQLRQQLAFLFWPDSTEAQARTNLRRALHDLRLALPDAEHYLAIATQWIQWRPDAPFTLDVIELEDLLAQAERFVQRQQSEQAVAAFEQVVALYRGPFLLGSYDDWVLAKREELAQRFGQALEQMIGLLESRRDYAVAIGYAQRLLRHDPLLETTYQLLMRLHARHGDRAGALRVFHECGAVLERELGVEPSAETRAAHAQLLNLEATVALPAEQPLRTADTPELVGRQVEWQQLLLAWQRAIQGHAHVVSLTGEAGIGKTRLAETLCTWVSRQGLRAATARAYEAEGGLAFAPLIDLLRSDSLALGLAALSDVWLAQVARLLPELLEQRPKLARPEPVSDPLQRQQFYEAMARAVLADGRPLLLVFDDMQWCDRETLECLRYLLRFAPQAQLLVLMTERTGETAADHPLHSFKLNLRSHNLISEMELPRLTHEQTTALAVRLAGRALAGNQASKLYHHTEGNPFFVVEMIRADITQWIVGGEAASNANEFEALRDKWSPALSLPDRVKAVIQARLNQLTPQTQEIAQLAATIGRSFSLEMLARAGAYSEDELVYSLDELWQRHILREQGISEYDFSHPLIRGVAYAQISPMRRRIYHRRIAQTLELLQHHEVDAMSGLAALHYELAGDTAQAIRAYHLAARFAKQTYTYYEAVAALRKALALLETLPDQTTHQRQALELHLDLGWALMMAKDWYDPEAIVAYDRALALCREQQEREGVDAQMFEAIWGLHEIYLAQGQRDKAYETSMVCWQLAQSSGDPEMLLQAHHAFWGVYYNFYIGPDALQSAVDHAQMGINLYSTTWHHSHVLHYGGHDPGCCAYQVKAKAQWLLGFPDLALDSIRRGVDLALQLQHPFSIRLLLRQAAKIHYHRGEPDAVLACLQQPQLLRNGQDSLLPDIEDVLLREWAVNGSEPTAELATFIYEGYSRLRAQGAYLEVPFYLALFCEIYARVGQVEAAQRVIQEALEIAASTQEDFYLPELHRLYGTCLLARGEIDAAQSSFLRALEIAQAQGAKSLELRAAMSLSRLWAEQGQRTQAYELLAGVYNWFNEGFETADLREAKELLTSLAPA